MSRKIDIMPHLLLNDNRVIPMMGFGTGSYWQKPDLEGPFDDEVVEFYKLVIRIGYRHFDTAESYGTEAELGAAIRESGIPREEFYVTSKVCHGVGDIHRALEGTLNRLGTNYADMYLIYRPNFARTPQDLQNAWKDMEQIFYSHKASSIGVSNFTRHQIDTILQTATVKPAVNQIEVHPYVHNDDYRAWLQKQDIQVQGFFNLAPLNICKKGPLDRVLARIAKEHGVNENAVLIRWVLDQNVVSISTSRNSRKLEEYLEALDLELSGKEMSEITEVGRMHRFAVHEVDWST